MIHRSPLWPAKLDHIRLDTGDPAGLAAFYAATVGFAERPQADGSILLHGRERRLVVGGGTPGTQPYSAFRLGGPAQIEALRAHLAGQGVPLLASPSPVFDETAFAVRDPDGRLAVFGLPLPDFDKAPTDGGPATDLPGRLQH